MAHVKGTGTTSLGRDSQGQRLGVKLYGGEIAQKGNIIVRQRGTKFHAGQNVKRAVDDSLFATATGKVSFKRKKIKNFTGKLRLVTLINVIPAK